MSGLAGRAQPAVVLAAILLAASGLATFLASTSGRSAVAVLLAVSGLLGALRGFDGSMCLLSSRKVPSCLQGSAARRRFALHLLPCFPARCSKLAGVISSPVPVTSTIKASNRKSPVSYPHTVAMRLGLSVAAGVTVGFGRAGSSAAFASVKCVALFVKLAPLCSQQYFPSGLW